MRVVGHLVVLALIAGHSVPMRAEEPLVTFVGRGIRGPLSVSRCHHDVLSRAAIGARSPCTRSTREIDRCSLRPLVQSPDETVAFAGVDRGGSACRRRWSSGSRASMRGRSRLSLQGQTPSARRGRQRRADHLGVEGMPTGDVSATRQPEDVAGDAAGQLSRSLWPWSFRPSGSCTLSDNRVARAAAVLVRPHKPSRACGRRRRRRLSHWPSSRSERCGIARGWGAVEVVFAQTEPAGDGFGAVYGPRSLEDLSDACYLMVPSARCIRLPICALLSP